MTALVGVLCRDGVVLGADSSTTFGLPDGNRTIEQQCEKLDIVDNRIIIAGTGSVGFGQRFCAVVRTAWTGNKLKDATPVEFGKTLSRLAIEDFAATHARPGNYGAMVAFPCKGVPCLCELGITDMQPELKVADRIWYSSLGSAQPIMDPFLAFIRGVFWQGGQPHVRDGIFAAVWTLDHAIEVNPGGVNGPARIAVLERVKNDWTARMLAEEDLLEHRQNIEQAKNRLRDFRAEQASSADAPTTPK